ncbi:hypothetical protein MRX96_027666 [Rhipicephalus microplus]
MLRARAVSVNAERTRVTKKAPRRRREVGGSPARSLAAVVNHSSPRTPAEVPAKDQRRRQVIVVGDSNMARVGEVIKGRVGDDERVKVSKLPGKRVGEVMQQAKEQLWDRMEDRSLVVVMGGVNDVLQGRGAMMAALTIYHGGRRYTNRCLSVLSVYVRLR